jgi:hypothetical protein
MRRLSIPRLIPFLLCSVALVGCEGASGPELNFPDPQLDQFQAPGQNRNPFLGSWKMTSAVVGDDELVAGTDFLWIVNFRSDGTHSVSVSNDFEHLVCKEPSQTSCEWNGTYTYTAATITTEEPNHPDPGEAGEDTGYYAHCGGRWFYLDDADDGGIRLTYKRTRRDCYARDCY